MRLPHGPGVKVDLTPEIIKAAKARDSSHCMIAEAIKTAYPKATAVAVDLQTIRFSDRDRGLRFTYLTPRIGQIHLIRFDQGQEVEPISFHLRKAHVTACGSKKRGEPTATKSERGKKGSVKAALSRKGLRFDGSTIPVVTGGNPPPMDVSFARRRAFGLRALAL